MSPSEIARVLDIARAALTAIEVLTDAALLGWPVPVEHLEGFSAAARWARADLALLEQSPGGEVGTRH